MMSNSNASYVPLLANNNEGGYDDEKPLLDEPSFDNVEEPSFETYKTSFMYEKEEPTMESWVVISSMVHGSRFANDASAISILS